MSKEERSNEDSVKRAITKRKREAKAEELRKKLKKSQDIVNGDIHIEDNEDVVEEGAEMEDDEESSDGENQILYSSNDIYLL